MPLDYSIINTTKELQSACDDLAQASHVAVDCEFIRDSSYYSDLCLVQLASPEAAFLVDPKADDIDLAPLLFLLNDCPVTKVFHSGEQDIEIFYEMTKRIPNPVFDTQIAAMAIGFGEQVGYQSLIGSLLKIQIEKTARFSDWAKRPLDKKQLDYAASDVIYLTQAYPIILKQLQKEGRLEWIAEPMAGLVKPERYRFNPDEAWKRIKIASRKRDVLGRLKALVAWREAEAANHNVPRGRILRDDVLAGLAQQPVKDREQLARARGVPGSWKNKDIGNRFLKALNASEPLSLEEVEARRSRNEPLNKTQGYLADLLSLFLKMRCEEKKVAPRMVAQKKDLNALVMGVREGLPFLDGWRYDLFGYEALDLIEGRLTLMVEDDRLIVRKKTN